MIGLFAGQVERRHEPKDFRIGRRPGEHPVLEERRLESRGGVAET
jgi:hypothetical protein